MKDITNEVKDFKKYFIIPKDDVAMEIHSANPEDAMSCFAWAMDSDMNAYFRAVTEEEYEEIKDKRLWEARKKTQVDFYIDELENCFDIPEDQIPEVADNAYKIYCHAGSYPYCDVETEYDALNKAYDEWWEENGEEDDEEGE